MLMTDLGQELISIIVPAYNSEQFIGECLSSISNQTYHNWECIVVDDHSNDNSYKLALKYAEADSRFRVFKRPVSRKKGAPSCRNIGFEKSKGVYVKWFDSDDIMLESHLEIVVSELSKNNFDFVVTESEMFGDIIESRPKPYHYDSSIELNAKNVALNRTGWITNDLTIKRTSLGEFRFNEFLNSGQEYNLNIRLLDARLMGKIINVVCSMYRQHRQSISSKRKLDQLEYKKELINIKYETAKYLNSSSDIDLKKWFLAGYMRIVHELIIEKKVPKSLIYSLSLIYETFGFFKILLFILGLIFGYFFKKGYSLIKLARTFSYE